MFVGMLLLNESSFLSCNGFHSRYLSLSHPHSLPLALSRSFSLSCSPRSLSFALSCSLSRSISPSSSSRSLYFAFSCSVSLSHALCRYLSLHIHSFVLSCCVSLSRSFSLSRASLSPPLSSSFSPSLFLARSLRQIHPPFPLHRSLFYHSHSLSLSLSHSFDELGCHLWARLVGSVARGHCLADTVHGTRANLSPCCQPVSGISLCNGMAQLCRYQSRQ